MRYSCPECRRLVGTQSYHPAPHASLKFVRAVSSGRSVLSSSRRSEYRCTACHSVLVHSGAFAAPGWRIGMP